MEDKISKGGNYKRFKKRSKRYHGNSGPENFVHPLSKFLDPPLKQDHYISTGSCHLAETKHKVEPRFHEFSVIHILYISRINTFGYLEHDVARGILKFQCKPWEFRTTSCSRHPDVFIVISMHNLDGWVRVLRPFNSISVISRRWKGEHERLCAMKRRLGSGRISPPAGFEPATPWSEVGSANRSATRTLHAQLGFALLY